MLPGQQQWQPSSLLPDLTSPAGLQQMRELREEAQKLPTDLLVVLVSWDICITPLIRLCRLNYMYLHCSTCCCRSNAGLISLFLSHSCAVQAALIVHCLVCICAFAHCALRAAHCALVLPSAAAKSTLFICFLQPSNPGICAMTTLLVLLLMLLPCTSPPPSQAGLTVQCALVPAQLISSWGGTAGLVDSSGADQHIWARWVG